MTTAPLTGQLLRVGTIDIPEEYERKESLVEDDALLKSIQKSGVQQSVVVHPEGERFIGIKGGRRVRISEHLGLHTIPAVIVVPPMGEDVVAWRNRLRFILTQARQDLLPSQRASLIKQLMSMYGMKQKDVAAYLGVDAGSITNWIRIEDYAPEIVKAVDRGEINLHQADALRGVKPEAQPKVFRSLRKQFRQMSGRKLRDLVGTKFSPSRTGIWEKPPKSTSKRTTKRRRPKLTRDEKQVLSRDLSLLEVELQNGQEELRQLEREIRLSAQPINAIMRSKTLKALLSDSVREEFERFIEVY